MIKIIHCSPKGVYGLFILDRCHRLPVTFDVVILWLAEPCPRFQLLVYLLVGLLCGPWVLSLLSLDIVRYSVMIGRINEMAMALSLFITGLKIRHALKSAF